jgi:hypothetical protein
MSRKEYIRRVLKEDTSPFSNEKLVQIFHKQLMKKDSLNFNGIILKPKLINDYYIQFDMDNPNDLSYSETAITDYVNGLFNEFIKLLDLNRFKIKFKTDEKFQINTPKKFYINKIDYNNIRERIVNVKKFRFQFFRAKVDLIGDVKFNEFWFNLFGDEFNLTVNAKLTNFKLESDEGVKEISNDELHDFLEDGSNGDRYLDYIQDDLYADALNYIWVHPTLYNQDNMSLNLDLV